MGYGGFLVEYYLSPKELFHVSIASLLGVGGVMYSQNHFKDDHIDGDDFKGNAFFVAEPEVNLFINLTRFWRIGIGATYRYTYGLDGLAEDAQLSDELFTGFNSQLQFQFGWF